MRPAVVYFLQFCAFAAPGRFASVLFSDYGLSDQQVGFVLTLPVVLTILTVTPSGAVVDALAHSKPRLIAYITVASALVLQALFLFPASSQRDRFVSVLLLFAVFRVVRAPSVSISDAYALEWLEQRERDERMGFDGVRQPLRGAAPGTGQLKSSRKYGGERLWGAVSFGMCSLSIGLLYDRLGMNVIFAYNAAASLVYAAFAWALTARDAERLHSERLPGRSDYVPNGASNGGERTRLLAHHRPEDSSAPIGAVPTFDRAETSSTAWQLVWSVVTNARTVIFLFTVASVAVGTSLVGNLVFLYFVNDLHASKSLCGLSVVITVMFEIPLFYCGEHIDRYLTRRQMVLLAMCAYVTRAVIYTLVPRSHPWLVLLVEPLHGVTYGLMQMATVQAMYDMAPPHLRVTAQTLLSTSKNVGTIVGTLGGSYIMQHYESKNAYRLAAGLVASAAALYAWASREPPLRDPGAT